MACRNRKVKCNLGHPDNPSPPCQRCKRESKHCFFSSTRRKNYNRDSVEPPVLEDPRPIKRVKTGSLPTTLPDSNGSVPPRPRTPGGSESLVKPLRPRERSALNGDMDEDDPEVIEDTAEVLQKTEIHHGPDALGLLSTVALAAHSGYRGRTQSSGSLPRFNKEMSGFHSGFMAANSPKQTLDNGRAGITAGSPYTPDNRSANPDLENLLKSKQTWAKMRFVRAGIFTVQEGMDYLNYFYQYLNPLTPVTVPRFQDPSTHAKLLDEEPILAVTMLTIASRYVQPKGPAAGSRSYRIHDALWGYLSQQIERLIFGQEQFGGGFVKNRSASTGPKGLRTLGTVESLLLLTEWHARALHFPPGADSEELLIGDFNNAPSGEDEDESEKHVGGWLEPCWRSDRMVWSMLSIAQSLAAELGVFDDPSTAQLPYAEPGLNEEYLRRKENARRLLFIYITQTSGRLSLPSIISGSLCLNMFPNGAPLMGKNQPRRVSTGTIPYYQIQETVLYFWYHIAVLFADGNAKLFASRETTRHIISSGQYVGLLAEYEQAAQQWQHEFQSCTVIPQHMRHILTIEFEYASIYVNSIGLQAIINRCIKAADSNATTISPATLLDKLHGDRIYLEAILKSSHKFLRAVVDGLLPEKYLKHSPVRTYLRIISVCMMLLKTFALGAMGNEVTTLLELLDRATRALRDCVVDDVHIGSSVAELIGILTNRARSRMIRIKASTDKDKKSTDMRKTASQNHRTYHANRATSTVPPGDNSNVAYNAPSFSMSAATPKQHTTLQSPLFNNSPSHQHSSPLYEHPPNVSIMPPSSWTPDGFFGGQNGGGASGLQQANHGTPNSTDFNQTQTPHDPSVNYDFTDFSTPGAEWAALPLDNLLGGSGGDFTQTGYGLELGGRDMLDVLLMDEVNGGHTA